MHSNARNLLNSPAQFRVGGVRDFSPSLNQGDRCTGAGQTIKFPLHDDASSNPSRGFNFSASVPSYPREFHFSQGSRPPLSHQPRNTTWTIPNNQSNANAFNMNVGPSFMRPLHCHSFYHNEPLSTSFSTRQNSGKGLPSLGSEYSTHGGVNQLMSKIHVPLTSAGAHITNTTGFFNPLEMKQSVKFFSQGQFQPQPSPTHVIQPPTQEESDQLWLRQWLGEWQLKQPNSTGAKKTLKICEAQNLFRRYLSLNEKMKHERDELVKNVEAEPDAWNNHLEKANETKDELISLHNILSDPDNLRDLQDRIEKRKRKRLWLENRSKRRYLEKLETEKRREMLHGKINQWQKEIIEKDLAARKAASLKHEAGGVLGEVRRKLQDCHKMEELIKSLIKLREIRKAEGEKKGVYPKTSSVEDRTFTARCDHVKTMVRERIGNYEEEEKALRVMLMEEEEEREKKERQQRLEEKALLNLSKESDPLADFRRYYEQANESIEYLIQIRREWDVYLAPANLINASRIPDGDVSPANPSSDSWASVLKRDAVDKDKLSEDRANINTHKAAMW